MPGPMSDSYDPEWGTSANAGEICEYLDEAYRKVSEILGNRPPIYILDLVRTPMPEPIQATLTTKEWRIIRFALERAKDSI